MAIDISNIHFRDARIVRVTEDVDRRILTFEVSYPIPDGGCDFPRRKLIFQCCSRYFVDEGRMPGEPTIQRVEIMDTDPHQITIRMHTANDDTHVTGVREVTCHPTILEKSL